MKSILIFTYIDRENTLFLPLWISHYSKIINSKLVILYRNVKPNITNDQLHKVELINVNHFFNEKNNAEFIPPNELFISYQHEFLLTYDVVIYSDNDEFIVHNNINELLNKDFDQCLVTTGIEIVHNLHCEKAFNFQKKINDQRKFMIKSVWYNKPLIVNKKINWVAGKHNFNKYDKYVDGLYLIHLGKMCLDLTKKLIEETKILYPLHQFNPEFVSQYKNNFNNPSHKNQPMVDIPEKIKDLINNIL
jgi:hypothetical protein